MSDYEFKVGEYTTRCGLPVRLYATDGGIGRPLHGALFNGAEWELRDWLESGMVYCGRESPEDIMPPKRFVWLNLYEPEDGFVGAIAHKTKESADELATCTRIGRMKVEVTPGVWDE